MKSRSELLETFGHIYEMTDYWCSFARKQYQVACKEGCDFCCYSLTSLYLFDVVRMLSNPRVRIIYEDNGHELREREKPFWNGDLSYRSKPYYEKNIPCIFLKNNKCEIYSVRPLVCATHLSLDQCKKEDEGTRLVNPKQFRDMCVQMYIRICQFTDIPFLIAPMPVMLRMGNIYLNAGSKGLIDTYGEDVLNPEKMIARWIPFEI